MSTLAVIAKAPVAGRSKTRLSPPCTPPQAAAIAEAALIDTLTAVVATPCDRRVLVLDGHPGAWADGFEVLAQRGDGLDERLAAAFDDIGGSTFLIGMDTPQVTPALLAAGLAALRNHDAVLGLATDGGYWSIGFAAPMADALVGVPMSEDDTGAAQLDRLISLGLRTAQLEPLIDVDHWPEALVVASAAPSTRFADAVGAVARSLAPSSGREER